MIDHCFKNQLVDINLLNTVHGGRSTINIDVIKDNAYETVLKIKSATVHKDNWVFDMTEKVFVCRTYKILKVGRITKAMELNVGIVLLGGTLDVDSITVEMTEDYAIVTFAKL